MEKKNTQASLLVGFEDIQIRIIFDEAKYNSEEVIKKSIGKLKEHLHRIIEESI